MSRQDAAAVAAPLVASYVAAWGQIDAAQRDAIGNKRKLRALPTMVNDTTDDLDAETYDWASNQFAGIYSLGAIAALDVIGGEFEWTDEHAAAATALTEDVYERLIAATNRVDSTAEVLGRIDDAASRDLAGRQLERLLARRGISAVTYSNGARYGLADYAQMVIRTATSIAFSTGTLMASRLAGVEYVEVSDGPGCGWESHNDGDGADGKITTGDDAAVHLLAHPNCGRSFVARPDIQTPEQALAAGADFVDDSA